MKISIIVPLYNAASTIRRCVDSILSQTFTDFEIILVDDGSKDNSLAICEEYALADSRVKVIHKENGGASSARNAGLDVARGEWICFVDADDSISEEYFPKELVTIYDLYVLNQTTIGDCVQIKDESCDVIEGIGLDSFFKTNLSKAICKGPWAKIYKSTIIKNNNITFCPEFKIGEDYLFNLEYFSHVTKIIMCRNAYYFVERLEDYDEHKKYSQTLDKSISYLNCLVKKYKELPYKNIYALLDAMNYQMMLCDYSDLSMKQHCRWLSDESICYIKNSYYKTQGCSGAVKSVIYTIVRAFLKLFSTHLS